MEEDLISKKELLDETGISYGQLYRWKRKQLIPEEWFIRKSTFTGQETFFPRARILGRVQHILQKKEDLSLDELADKLSEPLTQHQISLTVAQLRERNIVSDSSLERFGIPGSEQFQLTFEQILNLFTVDMLLGKGELNLEEADRLYQTLGSHMQGFGGKGWELFFVRKMGVSFFLMALPGAGLVFDEGVRLVCRLSLADLVEQLKGRLS
ncbi:YhbD family protein [Paenibacillus sp. MMS20-IR301]|uniref:YhbD family protein n=1 Tax=Paenibacillus sp. MMS20-IR301 TaxID=2895946 RepID=UPI0028EB1D03|nr:YhbD family protein [Paenibacillus sp. MMS20-IR301]WNS44590.1 YhbD family protein [Paenibacillus sp. MMS20-IR301]